MKRPSSNPSPRKNGSSNTQTQSSQTASTNWTDQSRLFCSGWELGTTGLMPICTSSRLTNPRCVQAMQTSWLQNIYCSTVNYMMLCGWACGQNWHYWGTSSMATWRSWGGQPLMWGWQASPSSVRRWQRRRILKVEKTAGHLSLEEKREEKLLRQSEKMKRLPSHPLHFKFEAPTENRLKRLTLNHLIKVLQQKHKLPSSASKQPL